MAASALVAGAALVATPPAAAAAASEWAENTHGRLRLIAAGTAVDPQGSQRLGLQFQMEPGWKVYWRSPGDAGFPPSIDWNGSRNLTDARMAWPAPERFSVLGFNTLGYKDEVVFPIEAAVTDPAGPLQLRALVSYLTCDDICVPYEVALTLDLPAGTPQSSPFAHLIDRYTAEVPEDGAASGLSLEALTVAPADDGETLVLSVRGREPLVTPDVYLEGPELFEFGLPEVEILDGGTAARLTVAARSLDKDAPSLVGTPLTVTVVDGPRAMETVRIAAAGDAAPAGPGARPSLLLILGLGLLGGLILNLMPCVLPVLSLKVLGVVRHGGGHAGEVRLRFLATAAGVVGAFLALAAALALLKTAGVAVGWGIQFQQPFFLMVMTTVLVLFAANMWGLFEFRLPAWLGDAVVRGEDRAARRSPLAGDVLTGAFATLLATPCTAPFLGTAVGFALTGGTGELFVVFAALGVGLALPYLLVAALPALATRLPRPGRWMVWLKQVLGLALAATAVWLVTILAVQTSSAAAAVVGVLMVVLVAVLWFRARMPRPLRLASPVAVVLLAALAVAAPWHGATVELPADGGSFEAHWRPFDRAAIPGLVAQGKTVFVDVTADWCVTCQANKQLVLNRGEVVERLHSDDVVAMVADWTRPDPSISDYLADHGRYGIPFNIVYGPNAPSGIALPELLSRSAVLDALDRAGQTATAEAGQ